MRAFAVQSSMNPDIGFALYVHDSDYDEAKKLAFAGLFAWLGDEDLRNEFFPELEEDDDYWYIKGYFEPAIRLLDRNGIEYLIENCFNEEGDWEGKNVDVIEEIL